MPCCRTGPQEEVGVEPSGSWIGFPDFLGLWRSTLLSLHLISLQEELGNHWSIPGIIKAGKDLQDHVQATPSRPLFALGAFQVFHLAAIPWDGPAARTGAFKDE